MNTSQQRSVKRQRTSNLAKIAIFSALSLVLMLLEIPLPLFPTFLKFDLSDLPALLIAFSVGPLAGVVVELIKNILHLPMTSTFMVGELANFIVGGSFVLTAGLLYRSFRHRKGAILSLIAGTLVMTIVGALFNYYINIPFYIHVMGFELEAIIALTRAAGNTRVTDLPSLITWGFVPFNLLKGAILSILALLTYKKVKPLLPRLEKL